MTVGHLNTFFAQVAGNLKSQILKSSNSRRLPGEGVLKFLIDRYISIYATWCTRQVSGAQEILICVEHIEKSYKLIFPLFPVRKYIDDIYTVHM